MILTRKGDVDSETTYWEACELYQNPKWSGGIFFDLLIFPCTGKSTLENLLNQLAYVNDPDAEAGAAGAIA